MSLNPLRHFNPREQWRGLLGTVVIILSIVVIVLSVTHHEQPAPYTPVNGSSTDPAVGLSPSATPSATVTTKALIIGDEDAKGVAAAMCGSLKWTCTVNAVASTGYVAGGASAYGSPTRISASIAAAKNPSVIVVTGGRHDAGTPVATEDAAILKYVLALHTAAPAAKLVFIGPYAGTDPALDAVDSSLTFAHAGQGVVVASPRAAVWLPATDVTAAGALTPAGQQLAAAHIIATLRGAGLS